MKLLNNEVHYSLVTAAVRMIIQIATNDTSIEFSMQMSLVIGKPQLHFLVGQLITSWIAKCLMKKMGVTKLICEINSIKV